MSAEPYVEVRHDLIVKVRVGDTMHHLQQDSARDLRDGLSEVLGNCGHTKGITAVAPELVSVLDAAKAWRVHALRDNYDKDNYTKPLRELIDTVLVAEQAGLL